MNRPPIPFAVILIPLLSILLFGQERLRLPFQPTTAMLRPGEFSVSEAHRFAGVLAPVGEANLFRHALGMNRFGNTSMDLDVGILPNLLSSLAWESRHQTAEIAIKFSALQQNPSGFPLSLVISSNLAARNRSVQKGKRYSTGCALTVQRAFFENRWRLSGSVQGQTHTNLEIISSQPNHSIATSMGIIRRGKSMATFGDVLFPLHLGNYGYRKTHGSRAPDGIRPLAVGASFQLWSGSIDAMITNTTAMLYTNVLAGADEPTALRMMEWRIGLGYRCRFGFALDNKVEKAWVQ